MTAIFPLVIVVVGNFCCYVFLELLLGLSTLLGVDFVDSMISSPVINYFGMSMMLLKSNLRTFCYLGTTISCFASMGEPCV